MWEGRQFRMVLLETLGDSAWVEGIPDHGMAQKEKLVEVEIVGEGTL
jgi:hypothetical protein